MKYKEIFFLKDRYYKPFFITWIATLLTLGCMWGAINLFNIGAENDFAAVNYSWILAHGHAMVFGFVGVFIMGFSYQFFPKLKKTSLWNPALAFYSLPLMIAGIVIQTVAHLIAPKTGFVFRGITGGVIQVAAVLIFTDYRHRESQAFRDI